MADNPKVITDIRVEMGAHGTWEILDHLRPKDEETAGKLVDSLRRSMPDREFKYVVAVYEDEDIPF